MSNLSFFLTFDQVDALRTLQACRAAWPTFPRATWLALVKKALVTLDPKPRLTPAGSTFLALNQLLGVINHMPEADEPSTSHTRARALAPARQ